MKRGEILTDEAIEQRTQNKLFEVPSIYGTTHLVGNLPNGGLQLVSLLYIFHNCGQFFYSYFIYKDTIL